MSVEPQLRNRLCQLRRYRDDATPPESEVSSFMVSSRYLTSVNRSQADHIAMEPRSRTPRVIAPLPC